MIRRLSILLAVVPTFLACGSSAGNLTCPTKAQTLSYTAAGSCGGGAATGTVTFSTHPGFCDIVAKGAANVGLPTQGQFSGTATQTGYDLTKGNWYLFVSEGNAQQGSLDVNCDMQMQSGGVVVFTCSQMQCPPEDCGGSAQCATASCRETLTPTM